MPTKLFYTLLILITSITVFIKLVEYLSKKKYPGQAGFKNLKEIFQYYKLALKVITKYKWIFLVPIFITLLDSIVLLINAHEFILPNNAVMGFMNTTLENFIANIDLTRKFFSGMGLLSQGFYGVYKSNIIAFIYMLLILAYPFILKYIKRYIVNKNRIQYRIFKKVFVINLLAAILHYSFMYIPYITGIESNLIMNRMFFIIVSFSLQFIIISNFSFFGLMFLQYIMNSFQGKESKRKELIESSIDLYPQFLSLSLLIYFIVPLIIAISRQFIGTNSELRVIHDILRNFEIFVRFVFIPVPFLAVINRKRVSDTLENSLIFVTSKFKKFWQFTLVGIMGGFILGIVLDFLQFYLTNAVGGSLHTLYNSLIYIGYAVPFMVAFFLFLKDEVGKE